MVLNVPKSMVGNVTVSSIQSVFLNRDSTTVSQLEFNKQAIAYFELCMTENIHYSFILH